MIQSLPDEEPAWRDADIPADSAGQKRLLRELMNVRMPKTIGADFLKVQNAYLKDRLEQVGVVDVKDLEAKEDGMYVRQGDITRLKCDAIVNTANVAYGKMIQCDGTEYVQNLLNTGLLSSFLCHALAA